MTIEPKRGGTRAEHVAWARARALEYIDHKPPEIGAALASIASDLLKHDETSELCKDAVDVTHRYASGRITGTEAEMARKIRDWIESLV